MKTKLITLFSALLLTASSYGALTYSFTSASIGTTPTGPAPWLTFQIAEVNPTAVNITVTSSIDAPQFFSNIAINLNPAYDFSTPYTVTNYTQSGSFTAPVVTVGNNIYSGGGGIDYDVLFAMATAPPGSRFDGTDSFSFQVNGVGINDFEATLNPAVAHVQAIGVEGQSGWIVAGPVATQVPEASSALLGAVGALALLRRRRN